MRDNSMSLIAANLESLEFVRTQAPRLFSDVRVEEAEEFGTQGEHRFSLVADETDIIEVWERVSRFLPDQISVRRGRQATWGDIASMTVDESPAVPPDAPGDPKKVFVVHGRDYEVRDAIFSFLRSIGLDPLDWDDLVKRTGKGTPYNMEVVETGFREARAAIVLMTPDDVVRLRGEFVSKGRDEREEAVPQFQPRPNVLIEGGMAFARDPDRTVVVEFGKVKVPTDLLGRNFVRWATDNDAGSRDSLINRLETVGCLVERKGDWMKAGAFPARPYADPDPDEANVESAANLDPARVVDRNDAVARRSIEDLADWVGDENARLVKARTLLTQEMNERNVLRSGVHIARRRDLKEGALREYRDRLKAAVREIEDAYASESSEVAAWREEQGRPQIGHVDIARAGEEFVREWRRPVTAEWDGTESPVDDASADVLDDGPVELLTTVEDVIWLPHAKGFTVKLDSDRSIEITTQPTFGVQSFLKIAFHDVGVKVEGLPIEEAHLYLPLFEEIWSALEADGEHAVRGRAFRFAERPSPQLERGA